MRRVFCFLLLLLFIVPVFAEGLPAVEDAILADDGSIGSQANAPHQVPAQQGKCLPGEVHGESPAAREYPRPDWPDIVLSGENQQAYQQFQHPCQGSRQGRAACAHSRQAQEPEDQESVKDDIQKDCTRAYGGAFLYVVRDLHDHQIALGNTGHEIGPARDPQIVDADSNQFGIRCKKMHQYARKELAGDKKDD